MTVFPRTTKSILVLMKQSRASSGLQTIGSFSLNDVFIELSAITEVSFSPYTFVKSIVSINLFTIKE